MPLIRPRDEGGPGGGGQRRQTSEPTKKGRILKMRSTMDDARRVAEKLRNRRGHGAADSGRKNARTKRRRSDDRAPEGGTPPPHRRGPAEPVSHRMSSQWGRRSPRKRHKACCLDMGTRSGFTATHVPDIRADSPQPSSQLSIKKRTPPLPRPLKNSPRRVRTTSLSPIWLSIRRRPAFTRGRSSTD